MGAPMGNRNAAGGRGGRVKLTKEARRRKSLIGSTKNQIKNFSSANKRSERKALGKRLSKKSKTTLRNVRKSTTTKRLMRGL